MHTPADHLFVLLFVVVHPLLGYVGFRRLQARIAGGTAVDRSTLYLQTMVGHWLLFAAGTATWVLQGRELGALGLTLGQGAGLLPGSLIVAIALGLLMRQNRAAARADAQTLGRYRNAFGAMRHLVPRDRHELRRFYLLSATAGVVEEFLWRGFLIAYLSAAVPVGVAALVSAAGFGLAHAYQGWQALPRIALVGAVLTLLYVSTGSLLLPVLLHTALDALQGRLAWVVHSRLGNAGGPGG